MTKDLRDYGEPSVQQYEELGKKSYLFMMNTLNPKQA
jgi:hypothetical protein